MKLKAYFCIECGIYEDEFGIELNPYTVLDNYDIENHTCGDCRKYNQNKIIEEKTKY